MAAISTAWVAAFCATASCLATFCAAAASLSASLAFCLAVSELGGLWRSGLLREG